MTSLIAASSKTLLDVSVQDGNLQHVHSRPAEGVHLPDAARQSPVTPQTPASLPAGAHTALQSQQVCI